MGRPEGLGLVWGREGVLPGELVKRVGGGSWGKCGVVRAWGWCGAGGAG